MSEFTDISNFVLSTTDFINSVTKTKYKHKDQHVIDILMQKIKDMNCKLNRISENHNIIKNIRYYWLIKQSHTNRNKCIKQSSKEWFQIKMKLTKHYYTQEEIKFGKLHPNSMLEYMMKQTKKKGKISTYTFDNYVKKNIKKTVYDCSSIELDEIKELHECVNTVTIEKFIMDEIQIDINDIYNKFTEEDKKILDVF